MPGSMNFVGDPVPRFTARTSTEPCEKLGTAGVPEAVVDASAVVDILSRTPRGAAVIEALRGKELHAPGHLDSEVRATLVRMERQGRLGDVDLDDAVGLLAGFGAERHSTAPLLLGAAARR